MDIDEVKSALHSLERIYLTHVANLWKIMGFLLILSGWLVTSESARQFLEGNTHIKFMFLAIIVLSVLAWLVHGWINYQKSQSLGHFLSSKVDESIYKGLQVKLLVLVINMVIVIFLGTMIVSTLLVA